MATKTETSGWWWAALGVLCFSFTLPATRLAVPEFGGYTVGFGRAVVAALLAVALLLARRERLPARRHWRGLGLVALGVVFGFPVLTSLALRTVPSSHGAVVVGLLPAATAVAAVLLTRERPRPVFWLVCALGVVAVLWFAATTGAGHLETGDVYMLLAVLLAAVGYAEGGRLARQLDGWRVVSWALVFSLPFALIATLLAPWPTHLPSPGAWAAFGYVSMVSMFLGFFAWYRGLALGGVARAGQVQLVQPVLTVVWSALLLGEGLDGRTILAALLVVAVAALSRLTR
ncbi:DMT family transporter (plasmid) [Deinococcus metallilatus]|uniref:DMT family transporter n=1 Tax=Deinococcus metallilatus TaxID=1211322 RepID=A0AAJ5F736_9DEIO|nr:MULTISPECIES: DMT family transporter [Deinococcus]MBB5293810.1 drug/metabolite transporter (DMT)-like permease [Deinococcus metallilatus]QBY07233.1 DMT family transporter [Deinococcus metallilatus]RXJ14705.1 DMT family transporter [Deinococcus metallilatus]TLK30825.1 DMT family transporter [Deinococcus metallilatus]